MLVAGIQISTINGDFRANLEKVLPLYRRAAEKGAKLILLQEFWGVGFKVRPTDETVVERCSELLCKISGLCIETRTWCIAGSLPRFNKDRQVANAMAVIDPGGKIVAEYEKVNLFRPDDEHKTFASGSVPQSITVDGICIGLTICFDLRFPELFMQHREKGAHFFVVPAQWPHKRVEHWEALLRARAIDTQCYVLGVNRGGRDPEVEWGGRSQFIDPWGTVQDRCDGDEGIVYGHVDLERLNKIRERLPIWECRTSS